MSRNKPTLKDIAQTLGVSVTTVHRALHGKDGVGGQTCAEIQRLAAQMGYRTNYMASALKRKNIKLAVAFPEPTLDNRYYYQSLWQGVRRFFREVQEFNLEPLEFYYPLTPDGNGIMLKEIYERHGGEIGGLITIAVKNSQSSYFLEKFSARGVPVVLVGANLYRDIRLSCVKAYDELAGSLAAELLCSFYPGPFSGKVILTGNPVGSFSMLDQYHNVTGFQRYMEQNALSVNFLTAYNPDIQASGEQIRSLLIQHPDTYAIYATSARHTVQMSQVVEAMGLYRRVKLIGNDNFPESIDYLTRGVLTAVIDKKIMEQSYHAARLLFNYVIKGEYPPSNIVQLKPSILLRENASLEENM